jgi:hypothetical protein
MRYILLRHLLVESPGFPFSMAASTAMGLTAAAIVATELIMQFRPRLVAIMSIAAGTKFDNLNNSGRVYRKS